MNFDDYTWAYITESMRLLKESSAKTAQVQAQMLYGSPSPNVYSPAKLDLDEKVRIAQSLFQQGLISQKDMNTLLTCDNFTTHMSPTPAQVDAWLRKNAYNYSLSQDCYIKLPANYMYAHHVSVERIQVDPIGVIKDVENWHAQHSKYICLNYPWDWSDGGETRKIELEDFYGKHNECKHEKGSTPLLNSKNELWIICKKCGKDLELVRK